MWNVDEASGRAADAAGLASDRSGPAALLIKLA
jgi:hypothetical protein